MFLVPPSRSFCDWRLELYFHSYSLPEFYRKSETLKGLFSTSNRRPTPHYRMILGHICISFGEGEGDVFLMRLSEGVIRNKEDHRGTEVKWNRQSVNCYLFKSSLKAYPRISDGFITYRSNGLYFVFPTFSTVRLTYTTQLVLCRPHPSYPDLVWDFRLIVTCVTYFSTSILVPFSPHHWPEPPTTLITSECLCTLNNLLYFRLSTKSEQDTSRSPLFKTQSVCTQTQDKRVNIDTLVYVHCSP